MLWSLFILAVIIFFHGFKPFRTLLSYIFNFFIFIGSIVFPKSNYRALIENIIALVILPSIAIISAVAESSSYEGAARLLPRFYLLVAILSLIFIKNISFLIRNLKDIISSNFFRAILFISIIINSIAIYNDSRDALIVFIVLQVIIINLLKFASNLINK